MSKVTLDMMERGILPIMREHSDDVYEKTLRNDLVGKHVVIRNREHLGRDDNTRNAKGLYGYVTSVDEDKGTARVSLLSKEVRIPVRNLQYSAW